MTQELFQSATTVASLIRSRQVSARELVDLTFDRVDAVNPDINAVVQPQLEKAREQASAADAAVAAGAELGPLHGVPITVKDAFHVAGMATTWGNPEFKDAVTDWDATVVGRLQRAGAIIVGKSNVAFMLGDFGQTENPVFGRTANPWDTSRTPGGSTGGGAAAVAAGLTFLDYGTDLVGSIRIPAAFCGVYGLRPTARIVSLTGLQPPGPRIEPGDMTYMSSAGPLVRSARDLRVALQVTGGPEGPAAAAYEWRLPPPRHDRLADFRVGVVLDHSFAPVVSDVAEQLSGVLDALAKAGATIVEGWPADIDPMASYRSFGHHLGLFFAFVEPGTRAPTGEDIVAHENRRIALRAAWQRHFADVDVFLCPVNFTAAFPYDSRPIEERLVQTSDGALRYDLQPFWTAHAAVAGLPAVAAPIGRTGAGLPVGVQILGPMYADDTAITFADLLANVVGGYERPPV